MIKKSALMYALSELQETEHFRGLSNDDVAIIKETHEIFLQLYLEALLIEFQLEHIPKEEQ